MSFHETGLEMFVARAIAHVRTGCEDSAGDLMKGAPLSVVPTSVDFDVYVRIDDGVVRTTSMERAQARVHFRRMIGVVNDSLLELVGMKYGNAALCPTDAEPMNRDPLPFASPCVPAQASSEEVESQVDFYAFVAAVIGCVTTGCNASIGSARTRGISTVAPVVIDVTAFVTFGPDCVQVVAPHRAHGTVKFRRLVGTPNDSMLQSADICFGKRPTSDRGAADRDA
jgi:hypothetical protein